MAKRMNIGQVSATLGPDINRRVKAVKLSLFSAVILNTRVKSGRLRGNWQTSVGRPIQSTTERLDPNGNETVMEAAQTVTADNIDYISNNLPYAEVWNERDGIIDKAVARLQRILKEAMR